MGRLKDILNGIAWILFSKELFKKPEEKERDSNFAKEADNWLNLLETGVERLPEKERKILEELRRKGQNKLTNEEKQKRQELNNKAYDLLTEKEKEAVKLFDERLKAYYPKWNE